MNKFRFLFTLLIAGLVYTYTHSAKANECIECKKFEKGVTTTLEKTGNAIKSVGQDIGRGLDKMLRWAFKPQK